MTNTFTLYLRIEGLPKMVANGSHGSWKSKHFAKKKWKDLVKERVILGRLAPDAPLTKAKLTLVRHSSMPPDFDGLTMSFKPIVDALVESGVLIDDNMEVVIPEYKWEKVGPRKGYVEITVSAV
jgi:hypothetical protein